MRDALFDEDDSVGHVGVIGKKRRQAVDVVGPFVPNLHGGILGVPLDFLAAFDRPILFARNVDLVDGIGEVDPVVVVAPGGASISRVSRSGLPCSPFPENT